MKKTIILITGRKAAGAARKIAQNIKANVIIHESAVDVAAFLSIEAIAKELEGKDLKGASMIIIPGEVCGDASMVTERFGIPCFKGPRNVSDLPPIMEKALKDKVNLSPTTPADELASKELLKETVKALEKAYHRPEKYLYTIGRKEKVYIGSGTGHVVAEINDAPHQTPEELMNKAKYYVSCGAEVIDLGMVASEDNSGKIGPMIETLRKTIRAPLSIDSYNDKEILSAADADIDLVLSIGLSNVHLIDSIDVPYVLIPKDAKGAIPHESPKRVALLEKLLNKSGGKKAFADPVLFPLNSGFTESLRAYALFRENNPDVPMLLGAGNVTELLDADSPGANAILAGIASELDIDLLFTTEASPKTRGSVRELAEAAKMMYLSKTQKQSPKDLGIDLLILKDKRRNEPTDAEEKTIQTIEASQKHKIKLDDRFYKIYLTDKINAVLYIGKKPAIRVTGNKAEDVYKELIGRGLVKDPGHSAYLGKELYKAETALRLGKDYVQDGELF